MSGETVSGAAAGSAAASGAVAGEAGAVAGCAAGGAPGPSRQARAARTAGIVLALVAAGAYALSVASDRTIAGLRAGGVPIGGLGPAELRAAVDRLDRVWGQGPLRLRGAAGRIERRRSDAGLSLDRPALLARAAEAGRTGDPLRDLPARARARRGLLDVGLPVRIDRARLLAFMEQVKADVDRPALDARLDLAGRGVLPEEPGVLVDLYGSAAALAAAVAEARTEAALRAETLAPRRRAADLGEIDISTVLGAWETRYSMRRKDDDRAWNLRLAADRLDGHVLPPGEAFSFNEVVGDRSPDAGYRTAPVIAAGELVDGWAGGACQISSTLFAAAFFAGLDIVSTRPHSRPSGYIPMALDSTVVYPSVDLRLRNPYPFPVAIHYTVALGVARAEVLGRERPHRVVFERETLGAAPFSRVTRRDPDLPAGQTAVDQLGIPGYRVMRRRLFLDRRGQETRREEWTVAYPPTVEVVRVGTVQVRGKPPPPPPRPALPKLLQNPSPILRIER